jgi:glycosyltransferase involved in cell wall biosynthesis
LNVWAKRRLEKRVYRHAARLITLSQAFADVLVERYAVDPLRIRVVPPAVDGQAFAVNASRSDARDALEWPKDRPIVFCVRRLARRMGLENLIDAWREVRRTVPDALLVIGGKGPLAAELADRISASTLHEHVVLAGFIPDAQLPLAYRAADLTVVPTQELEGFGLVTLESQAAGTPALVTPVGGLPDGVRDLAPQLVLPDKTTAAIAAGLQGALLGRVTLPDQEACQRHVRSRFSWPLVRERVLGVYAEAL